MELHSALKTEEIASVKAASTELKLIKLIQGRERSTLTLHANPTSFSTSGLQTTDVLSVLGFTRGGCAFMPGGQCYARAVADNFNINEFVRVFPTASQALIDAEGLLRNCGLTIGTEEGWGYFLGSPSRRHRWPRTVNGDGHKSPKTSDPKKSTDNLFSYAFTFIEGGADTGWVTHIWPVNSPLSPEHQAIFKLLEFHKFPECPQNDFNTCWWFFTPYQQREETFHGSNAHVAHEWFDRLGSNFASAIEKIILVHKAFFPFDMPVLRIPKIYDIQVSDGIKMKATVDATVKKPQVAEKVAADKYEYDIALSYASEDINYPEKLAALLGPHGVKVFFDKKYEVELWGADLYRRFTHVFKSAARYCVIFASASYAKKIWTNHELKAAQARALEEGDNEYILPVRLDDTEIPGLLPTVKYVDARTTSVEKLAEMVLAKLGKQ